MNKNLLMATLSVALVLTAKVNAVPFSDDFESPLSGWTTDRYAPASVSTVPHSGDNSLRIEISTAQASSNRGGQSGAFYNTQGIKHDSIINGAWTMSADLFISPDMMIDGNAPRRTDLWARTGNIGNETGAQYPIIGVAKFNAIDPFSANAAGAAPVWRVWDSDIGNWVILANAVTEGWHNLSITGIGNEYQFRLDGNLVHTDLSLVSVENLTTTFLQAYNFNQTTAEAGDYSVYWDNVNVAAAVENVPEGGVGFAGIAAIGGMLAARRRKK